MATVLKPRKPISGHAGINPVSVKTPSAALASSHSSRDLEEITVEKYLEIQFEEMIKDFREHTQTLIGKLKGEYQLTLEEVQKAGMNRSQDISSSSVVTLKAIGGPHTGQKFRLESTNENGEDEFKMGRSTGRLFKEKGVSLYKDKEISTTHAKIEFKNGGVFLIDMKSTNGTQLNEEDVEGSIPYKLAEGDKITMGSTVLLVHLSSLPEDA